jgi:hypothetical protein
VVTLPQSSDDPLGVAISEGSLVVLATSAETAARLAGAAVTDRLSVVLRGAPGGD